MSKLWRTQSWILWPAAALLAACATTITPEPTNTPPPPTVTPAPTASPTAGPVLQGVGSEHVDAGREAFLQTCVECHGENARGHANELDAPALDSSEHASEHPDQQIHDWIVNGKLGLGRQMPALSDQLDDGEVHAIIAYLHTLWTPEQLEVQQDISRRWPATPEPTWTPEP